MGAWGTGTFENDAAHDWLDDLVESDADDDTLVETLRSVAEADADTYLDVDESINALAACAAIATARDGQADLPERLQEWVDDNRDVLTDKVPLAIRALDRVLRRSELRDLWEEGDSFDAWKHEVVALRGRLVALPPS